MVWGLSFDTIAILWIGALFGGVAAGGSGFAFGVAASAIWLHRIDPVHCALMVTGCGVLLHSTTIWPQRHHIEFAKLWPFLVGGIGWYIFEARNDLDTATVFSGLLTVILIGLFVESVIFRAIEARTVNLWGMQR